MPGEKLCLVLFTVLLIFFFFIWYECFDLNISSKCITEILTQGRVGVEAKGGDEVGGGEY